MGTDFNEEYDEDYVTLELDDGSVVECMIIGIFECNDKEYIALLPEEHESEEHTDIFLYRYIDNGDADPDIEYIEDEEEYDTVVEAFELLMEEDDEEDGEHCCDCGCDHSH